MVKINTGGAPVASAGAGVDASGKPVDIGSQVQEPVAPKPADQSRTGAPSAPLKAKVPAPAPKASGKSDPNVFF
jgi:hypothetical protein